MFSNISWQQFGSFLLLTVLIYYILIGIKYYRHDVLRILRYGIKRDTTPANYAGHVSPGKPEPFSNMHELMDELKSIFLTATEQGYPKEELVTALQVKLKSYASLKDSQFKNAIELHILQSALSFCNTELDDRDIRQIW